MRVGRVVTGVIVAGLVAGAGITAVGAVRSGNADQYGVVTRVIDGDTLDARVAGKDVRLRLLNVDTPETVDPNRPPECLGAEASDFLQRRLPKGTKITLEYDTARFDSYGRTLVGVYEGNKLVNAEIAAAGLGVPVDIEPNHRFFSAVSEAYASAERSHRGFFDTTTICTLPAQAQQLTQQLTDLSHTLPNTEAEAVNQLQSLDSAIATAEAEARKLDSLSANSLGTEGRPYEAYWRSTRPALQSQLDQARAQRAAVANQGERLHADALQAARAAEIQRQEAAQKEAARNAEAQRRADEEALRVAAAARAQQEARAAAETDAQRGPAKGTDSEDASESATETSESSSMGTPGSEGKGSGESSNDSSSYPYAKNEAPAGYHGPRCFAPGGQRWRPC